MMQTTGVLFLILTSFLLSGSILAQKKPVVDVIEAETSIIGALFATEGIAKIDCKRIKTHPAASNSQHLESLVSINLPFVQRQFAIEETLRIGYVEADTLAYAVKASKCPQLQHLGKGVILVGEKMIDQDLPDLKSLYSNNAEKFRFLMLEKKMLVMAVLGHEMAHFYQDLLGNKDVAGKPVSFFDLEDSADYLAGWLVNKVYDIEKAHFQRKDLLKAVSRAGDIFFINGSSARNPLSHHSRPQGRDTYYNQGQMDESSDIKTAYANSLSFIRRTKGN